MNPNPELTPLLQKLRLSGLVATLDQRNLRLRRAGFRSSKTLERFDFDFNPKVPRELIQGPGSCRFVEEAASVLIVGPCGTGKSHLAQSLGH